MFPRQTLPDCLSVGACTISALFFRDVGPVSLDAAESALRASSEFTNIGRHQYDPTFFNPVFTMTALGFSPQDIGNIAAVQMPEDVAPYYQTRLPKLNLLIGCLCREQYYLFGNGVLVYQILVDISSEVETDEIIFLANCFVKYDPILTVDYISATARQPQFTSARRIASVRDLIVASCKTEPRTSSVETYTFIHVHKLGTDIESVLEKEPSLRLSLYAAYENEFHALCVRTIEEWRQRFPSDAHFDEPNASLSPVGILRINFRNTLAFEYPYSQKLVERLYYTAIIELRSLCFLLAIFLAHVQMYIDQIARIPIDLIPVNDIENKRHSILAALDDFNGYSMSTSRRTRHLYEVAMRLFEVEKLSGLLLSKLQALQEIVGEQKRNAMALNDRKVTALQVRLLDSIQRILSSQEATSAGITIISILAAGALAFNIASTASVGPKATFGIFILIVGSLYLLIKRLERRQVKSVMSVDVLLRVNGHFNLESLARGARRCGGPRDSRLVTVENDGPVLTWSQDFFNTPWFARIIDGKKFVTTVSLGITNHRQLDETIAEGYDEVKLTMRSNYERSDHADDPMSAAVAMFEEMINSIQDAWDISEPTIFVGVDGAVKFDRRAVMHREVLFSRFSP